MAVLVLALGPQLVFAQMLSTEKVERFYAERAGLATDRIGPGETADVWLFTPSLPVSFSRLEQNDAGDWRVGANVAIGASYVFMLGKGTGLEDGSVRVDPAFFIGLTGNFGVAQDPDEDGAISESFMLGGVLGFSGLSVIAGRDILAKTPILGVGGRIDLLTLTDKGSIIRKIK